MNISIRKHKHQRAAMTDGQVDFANECIKRYKNGHCMSYMIYSGSINNERVGCDIYTTKTLISAVVYKV